MTQALPSQRGFAAIAAVFLVVGLAALGAFMVSMSNTQQLTSAQDLQGTKAYWAARAGIEWGVAQVKASSNCPTSPTDLTIDVFTVRVTCGRALYTDGGTKTIMTIEATAYAGSPGSLGYVERSLSAGYEL